MTDVLFVAGAYAVVLGGLLAYGLNLTRRTASARRRATTIARMRRVDPDAAPAERAEGVTTSSEDIADL